MTRVVEAWDEGYEAGRDDVLGYSTTREARTPNPYQRSDVDADHVIAEAAWLSRQPGQGAGRASPQSHAPHRPALTEEDR